MAAFIFGIAFYYHKRTSFPFSYSIISNNIDALFYLETWSVLLKIVYKTFFASDFFWSLVFSGLIFSSHYFENKKNVFSKPSLRKLSSALSGILLVSLWQPYSFEPVSNFIRSASRFYYPNQNILSKKAQKIEFLATRPVQSSFLREKPHIFLILIESMNARFLQKKDPHGREYTPFLNQLAEKYLFFSNYYSNSVQTSKGHFAALCGQVSHIKNIEFKNSKCMTKKCLPTLLAEQGYKNYFFQADPNYNYDGNKDFFLTHGFQKVPELVQSCLIEKTKCYGLGIRDDYLYQRSFNYLIKKHKDNQPLFAALATVASHMPFNFQPEWERALYPEPKDEREHYLNSLRMVDDSLRVFFKHLEESPFFENSIVLITGDHAFPTGEHGSFHNENFAYQENFGVPLLIVDQKNDLKKIYSERQTLPFSHHNLGPTIIDLAGLSLPTDFIAPSIFAKDLKQEPIYLVQPYSGGMYSVLDWPLKYIFESYRHKDYYYDLSSDPNEMNPISFDEDPETLTNLRWKAAAIKKQQEILNCPNQIPLRVGQNQN